MKKYFELRDSSYNFFWHPAILLNNSDDTQTFELVSNEEKVNLKKGQFSKRELSINPIHLERLGFENDKKEMTEKNGLFLIPLQNLSGELRSLRLEFFGYILFKTSEKEKIKEKFISIFNDYNQNAISKKEVEDKFGSFYSINELFNKLSKEENFDFDELKIIRGK
jgi:hypothetical protein